MARVAAERLDSWWRGGCGRYLGCPDEPWWGQAPSRWYRRALCRDLNLWWERMYEVSPWGLGEDWADSSFVDFERYPCGVQLDGSLAEFFVTGVRRVAYSPAAPGTQELEAKLGRAYGLMEELGVEPDEDAVWARDESEHADPVGVWQAVMSDKPVAPEAERSRMTCSLAAPCRARTRNSAASRSPYWAGASRGSRAGRATCSSAGGRGAVVPAVPQLVASPAVARRRAAVRSAPTQTTPSRPRPGGAALNLT